MDYHDRNQVIGRTDRFAPSNSPDRDTKDELTCPYCNKITDDGGACIECLIEIGEKSFKDYLRKSAITKSINKHIYKNRKHG